MITGDHDLYIKHPKSVNNPRYTHNPKYNPEKLCAPIINIILLFQGILRILRMRNNYYFAIPRYTQNPNTQYLTPKEQAQHQAAYYARIAAEELKNDPMSQYLQTMIPDGKGEI
jgi:hypothetical protein